MENILRDAQAAGEVAAGVDCRAKAAEFIAYLEGAAVLWLLDETISLTDLYRTYITDFVATVSA